MSPLLTFLASSFFAGWTDGPALPIGSAWYLSAGSGKVLATNRSSAQVSEDGGRSWKDVPFPLRELSESNHSRYGFSLFLGHALLRQWNGNDDRIWNGSSWTRIDGIGGNELFGTASVLLAMDDASKVSRLEIDSGAGTWTARWVPSGSCATDPISKFPVVLRGKVLCRTEFDSLVGRGGHYDLGEYRWDGTTLYLVDTRSADRVRVVWSQDTGATWNQVDLDSLSRFGELVSQGGLFWHLTRRSWNDSESTVRRSRNFGAVWDTVLRTPVSASPALSCDGKGAFFLNTGSKMLASRDSGATWRGMDSAISVANVSQVVEDGGRLLVLDRGYDGPSRLWSLEDGKWTILRDDVVGFAARDGQILAGSRFALHLRTGDGSWEKVLDHGDMGGWNLKRAPDGAWWFAHDYRTVNRSVDGRHWDTIHISKAPADSSTDWEAGYVNALDFDRSGDPLVALDAVIGPLDSNGNLKQDRKIGHPYLWGISDLGFDRIGRLVASLDTLMVVWDGSAWKPLRPPSASGRYERMVSWSGPDGPHLAIFGPGHLFVDPDTLGGLGLQEFDWKPTRCGMTAKGLMCFDDHGRSHLLVASASDVRREDRRGSFAIRNGVLEAFLETAGDVRLEILDPNGRMLSGRDLGRMGAGLRKIVLPRVASGASIVRLRLDRKVLGTRLAPPGW